MPVAEDVAGGPWVDAFTSVDPDGTQHTVNMYKWSKPTGPEVAGLSTYIATAQFVQKVTRFMAWVGADMVDAWIVDRLCVRSPDPKSGWLRDNVELSATNPPALNCYHATTRV